MGKRVCLWGAAGAGKSAKAAYLFASLRSDGFSVELVQETIKLWAYQKRKPKSFDQCFIMANQLHAEDKLFQCGVKSIVTDSPVLMSVFYSIESHFACWPELLAIAKMFDAKHDTMNILLMRGSIPYEQIGRYHTEEEAEEVHERMKKFMTEHLDNFITCETLKFGRLLPKIKKFLS